ncbi:Hsp20/alpha crystallin family protein [Coraliomargarita algicola]|uniref:Hsp20/alpha crystallin family protein n=1 Tax=Coraliomargarita algicola TaxID=3092156 RepID=A0ABZ0RRS7_9BACT|nr:Hsp20/alpha crystallin family protein [Coraliomargarita sp. J2-16]WPJ97612.1 Hsp20/alpha crystallin family protein [Coraliomargarita sp. J2-16]
MKGSIIPQSWRSSLDELREDIAHCVDRWLQRLKPEDRAQGAQALTTDFWNESFLPAFNGPRMNVQENDDELVVTAELPDMRQDEIHVDLDGRLLRIHGQKEESREKVRGHAHISELRFGAFSRVVELPCEVDQARTVAKYRRGVLKLTLPKTEQAKARKIKVQYLDN